MAQIEYEITGTENLEKIFEQLPAKYGKKPIQAAFRKGARAFTTVLRRNTPNQTGETRKSIKAKAGKGPSITVGFSGKGQYMPGYFKAYWSNYGTLSNRNGSHTFTKRRRPQTLSWKGGIKATGFVERSWDETKEKVEQTITTELVNETNKFLKKYAV